MRRFLLTTTLVMLSTLAAPQAGEFYTKHKGERTKGQPTPDTALVYVFRPAAAGAAIKTWTFAVERLLGVTRAKGYSFARVPEGTHVFWAKAENTSALEVEVAGGETYYFKTAIRPGLAKARVKLVRIDEQEAAKYFKKCAYCEPTELGRQRAAEIAAARVDRVTEKAARRN